MYEEEVIIKTAKVDGQNVFPALFGGEIFNGLPLFSFAETFFYSRLEQMVPAYNGGSFDFYRVVEADVELEKTGFFPVFKSNDIVAFTSPFGVREELSFKAASMVAWIFVIEQIAHNVSDEIAERLFCVIQDIKSCYSEATDEDGNKLFSESDLTSIYNLID